MSDGIAIAKAGARDERGIASAEDASAAGATMRPAHEGAAADAEIVTIRPGAAVTAAQRLPCYVGVSQETAGARGISMNLVVIPPGGVAEPHSHRGFETAIYVLEGTVETRYGPRLAKSAITHAGDFLFIPAEVPHQPVNLSATEPARAIVARNGANEQESVTLYDPVGDR